MPRDARATAVLLGAPPATATLIRDTLLRGACGASSVPALHGWGVHLMCRKPQSAAFLVSASPHPCPHPGQKLASSSSVGFCSPCRTYVQGDLCHLSRGTCRVQGAVLVLRSGRNRSRTPIPFRRIPCTLGLLLGAVYLLCASTAFQKLPLTRADGQQEQRDHVRASAQARKHG